MYLFGIYSFYEESRKTKIKRALILCLLRRQLAARLISCICSFANNALTGAVYPRKSRAIATTAWESARRRTRKWCLVLLRWITRRRASSGTFSLLPTLRVYRDSIGEKKSAGKKRKREERDRKPGRERNEKDREKRERGRQTTTEWIVRERRCGIGREHWRVNERLLVVVHFVEEGLAREARLAVWVMYWHMYVIVAICRESKRKAGVADGERWWGMRVRRQRERKRNGERRRENFVERASRLAAAAERAMHHGIA